jgi:hypothetical protein
LIDVKPQPKASGLKGPKKRWDLPNTLLDELNRRAVTANTVFLEVLIVLSRRDGKETEQREGRQVIS